MNAHALQEGAPGASLQPKNAEALKNGDSINKAVHLMLGKQEFVESTSLMVLLSKQIVKGKKVKQPENVESANSASKNVESTECRCKITQATTAVGSFIVPPLQLQPRVSIRCICRRL
jgi:hypothetical protein